VSNANKINENRSVRTGQGELENRRLRALPDPPALSEPTPKAIQVGAS
jgi:hypothetical protein